MISMALEIRNKGLYHNCGETIDTPNGKAKIVDINFDGCFYIVECEDGFKSPIAFDTVYRLNDAKDNICSRHKVYDPNCRLCNVIATKAPDGSVKFHDFVGVV